MPPTADRSLCASKSVCVYIKAAGDHSADGHSRYEIVLGSGHFSTARRKAMTVCTRRHGLGRSLALLVRCLWPVSAKQGWQ